MKLDRDVDGELEYVLKRLTENAHSDNGSEATVESVAKELL